METTTKTAAPQRGESQQPEKEVWIVSAKRTPLGSVLVSRAHM
ncbi:hypothetical protein [Photobacterium arenosum]|nr:hypothetical protein [Photobacterium arenosum]